MHEPFVPSKGFAVALASAAAGGALVYTGAIIVNASRWTTPGMPALVWANAAFVVVAVCVFFAATRKALASSTGHVLGAILVGGAVANTAAATLLLERPSELHYLPFFIIGAAAVATDARWLVPTLLLTTAVGVGAALWVGGADVMLDVVAPDTAALVVAAVIFLSRRRSDRQVEAAVNAERVARAELASALTRLEAELVERERAAEERMKLAHTQAEMEAHMREHQHLESLGVLAGGVGHELNNVLAAVTSLGQAALASDAVPSREALEGIVAAAEQGASVTRNLLVFAGKGQRKSEQFAVGRVVAEVAFLLRHSLAKEIAVVTEGTTDIESVVADRGQIASALLTVAINAAEAIGSARGTITLRAKRTELTDTAGPLAAGVHVVLEVEDDGCGMSPEIVARVFEPFFTTKGDRAATGLGLATVYGVIREHKGDVRVESEPQRGTRVRLLLPSAGRLEQASPSVESKRGSGFVLLVDDEPLVRSGVQRLLKSLGYTVESVDGGPAAIRRLRTAPSEVTAVVLDLAMPGMNGAETFHALRDLRPDLPIVVTSGYSQGQDVDALLAMKRARFLSKPYSRSELATALEQLTT